MDGFEVLGKYDKMSKTKKLDAFENIKNNTLSVKEESKQAGLGGMMTRVEHYNQYNILQENDFNEKTWDLKELLEEQKMLRITEGEEKYLDKEYAHVRAKALAQKYTDLSKKDRRKSFKKYQKVMDEKLKKVTTAYGKRKTGSIKEMIKYEKQVIMLNEEARVHFLTGMMKSKEDLKVKLSKNRMRTYYRLLRMYIMHLNDPRITKKEKEKYTQEMNEVRAKLHEEFAAFWQPGQNDTGKKFFTWEGVTGVKDIKKKRTAKETQQLRAQYEQEEEQEKIDALSDKDIEAHADMIIKEIVNKQQKEQPAKGQAVNDTGKKSVIKKNFKYKNNKAAWEKFMRTGIWDPSVKKATDADTDKAEGAIEDWHIAKSFETVKVWLDDPAIQGLPDKVFKIILIKINEQFKENWKEFEAEIKDTKNGSKQDTDKKNRGWQLKLKKDLDYLVNWGLDTKGKTKEERKKKKDHIEEKRDELVILADLRSLNSEDYPEIEETVKNIYDELFHSDIVCFAKDTANLFSMSSHHLVDTIPSVYMQKLKRMGERKRFLDKNLKLSERGAKIYKSPVVHKLIVDDSVDEAKMKELTDYVKTVDDVIERMVTAKFGPLTRASVTSGVLTFLGDKGLVGEYRQIKDLTQQYLDGLSLTNIKGARLDADYRDAYESVFKGQYAMYGDEFEQSIQEFLAKNGVGVDMNEKGRAKKLKTMLTPIKDILTCYMNTVNNEIAGTKAWEKIHDHILKSIVGLKGFSVDEDYLNDIATSIKKFITDDKSKIKVTHDLWRGKEAKREKKEAAAIEEFNYSSMLKGKDLLASDEVKDIIKDEKMRDFIAENLDLVLINNKELSEQFPVLKTIESIDQLDDIHYSIFTDIIRALKVNITSNAATIKELLEKGTEKDERINDMRKQVLLNVLRKKGDGKPVDVSKMIQDELKRHDNAEEIRRKRLMYKLGCDRAQRSGKIRIRFEDLEGRDKSLLQEYFGKGKSWMRNRLSRMDQASSTWKRVESLGPAAVEQLKRWISTCYLYDDEKAVNKNFEFFAKMLNRDKNKDGEVMFAIDKDLEDEYKKTYGEKANLREAIREAVTGTKLGEKGKSVAFTSDELVKKYGVSQIGVKPGDVKDYVIELSLLNTQDIMYSHGGIYQGQLFNHYGNEANYKKMLMTHARFVAGRVDKLDKELDKYKDNPELWHELRDRFLSTWINTQERAHNKQNEITDSAKFLAEKKVEYREEYAKNEKLISELRKMIAETRSMLNEAGIEYSDIESLQKQREISQKAYNKKESEYKKLKEALEKKQKNIDNYDVKLQKISSNINVNVSDKEAKKIRESISKLALEKIDAQTEYTNFEKTVNQCESEFKQSKDVLEKIDKIINADSDLTKAISYKNILSDLDKERIGRKDVVKEMFEGNMDKLVEEYRQNSLLCGYDNLDQISRNIVGYIDKDGKLNGHVHESVQFFEEKKKMLAEYKGGELAEFWDYFVDNDKIFADLSSDNDFLEKERIAKLYDLLAPLARAIKDANAFVGRAFIETKLGKLLDDKCNEEEILNYRKEIEELNKKQKRIKHDGTEIDDKKNYWAEKLRKYESDFYDQTIKNTKSMSDNMMAGARSIQKDLAEAFWDTDEDVKRQFGMRRAKYRKWWFVTSKNTGVELVAQKGGQTKYQVAMANAESILMMMTQYAMGDEDCLDALSNTGRTKQYFEKLRDRFLENDAMASKEFLSIVLKDQYGIDIDAKFKDSTKNEKDPIKLAEARDELIHNALDDLSDDEKVKIEKLLTEFRMHVRSDAVNNLPEEFRSKISTYAQDFFEKKRAVNENIQEEVKKQKEAYDEKLEKRRGEQAKILNIKYQGRKLYDELLFGKKQQMLAEFGEKKQTLVYVPEKEKLNKKIKSKGEEKDEKHLDAAKELFKLTDNEKKEKHEEYPDILAECLDEYCRVNHRYYQRVNRKIDKVIGWFDDDFKTDIQEEADRLKKIYNTVRVEPEEEKDLLPTLEDQITSKKEKKKKVSIPEGAMDMFLVYAAKYGEKGTSLSESKINKLANTFLTYYSSLEMINKVNVKHPALKFALTDAVEKDRAYLFAFKDEDRSMHDSEEFKQLIESQIRYFEHADKAYAVIDDFAKKDKHISKLDETAKYHYISSLREYFTERILNESNLGTEFDAESYINQAKELVKDEEARNALTVIGESVSSEDYENHKAYPGELTKKDLEHAIAATRKDDLVEEYNKLNEEERALFALALYCSSQSETGSQRVIYGQTDEMLKEDREQILAFMKGQEVEFKVNYTRAIRAISAKSKNYKISGDTEKFYAALDFVTKVKNRKEQLRPKDYKRLSDNMAITEAADAYRRKVVGQKLTGITDHHIQAGQLTINDKNGFITLLEEYSKNDIESQNSQGVIAKLGRKYNEFKENTKIVDVLNRVNKLKPGQKSLLIYVLQDRTALDFSTAGKDSKTKIVPHVNVEKRFEIYEKLMKDEGRLEALKESSSPAMIRKAMKNLLGFQLIDDKELTEGKLEEKDFNPASLYRPTSIDWELLCHALDFLDEMERDKRKTIAVRQAPYTVLNEANQYDGKKKNEKVAVKFCRERFHELQQNKSQSKLDDLITAAYKEDRKDMSGTVLNPANWFKNGKELDDMMSGYRGLTPQQKVLFIRVLQHRDLLDVSQKNLYWNIFGLAERDFVSPKDRDELIDEYIADTMNSDKSFELNDATYEEALLSLLSTQVNDDMSFEKVEGSNWAYKNINVNNQLLVTDQRKATRLDWKLFKRALQFVTRATNERKMVAGDEALYKHIQGEDKFGKMKFDRKYLRRNLHNTGSAFMRFLAKEGYAEIDGKLGIFKSLADYSEYIVSTKTANYLHEQANKIAIKEAEEAEEEQAEEKEEKNADKQEKKDNFTFVKNLAKLTTDAKDQITKLNEMKNQAMESYNEFKDVLIENEEEEKKKEEERKQEKNKHQVYKEIKDVDGLPPKTDYLKLVISYGTKVPELKQSLDDFAQDTEKLEKIDEYIGKYLTEKISVKKLAEWYKPAENNEEKKDDDGGAFSFIADQNISKELKAKVDSALDFLSNSAEFIEAASGYLNSAIDVIGDFRNIVENAKNIMELEDTREEAKEHRAEDTEKIDNAIKDKKLSKNEQQKLRDAQQNNVALMDANTTMNKSIQGRKIVDSVAELTKKGLNFAGIETGNLLNKAADLVNFFYKCVSDKESLKQYFKTGALGHVEQILAGRSSIESEMGLRGKTYVKDENGMYNLDNSDITMIMNASGFERMEEFADYLRLNMVHSLLFSASKFNPLEEPKIIAKTALKILGLEDLINKTDSESAMKIFRKLQQ